MGSFRKEDGMLLHKRIEEPRICATREADSDDDTLIHPSRIP